MTIELKDKYDKDINMRAKRYFRDNIELSLKAHMLFLKDNSDYFNSPKRSSVVGILRNFAIEKQLYYSAFNPDAPYLASFVEVNNFHYNALYLKTENFLINIARTMKPKKLPSASKYRINNAKANKGLSGQMVLPFCEKDELIGERKYLLLTYNINSENELEHLGLIIPNPDLNAFYNYDNLLELPRSIKNEKTVIEEEKQVVKLKEDIQKQSLSIAKGV